MRVLKPARTAIKPFASLVGNFDQQSIRDIADQIRRDGYYVFPSKISGALCDEIAQSAAMVEARVGRSAEGVERWAPFDNSNPLGPVYDLPEKKLWEIPGYQKLIGDPIFLNLSQCYFGAASALKEVHLWFSPAMGGAPDSDAAQMFHFDYDATPIWLKFFIYLNDVTSENGPHVFVKGSHRLKQPESRELLSRGYVRISDQDIASVYGAENVVELAGGKGTVLAVDTMGFHKGKAPSRGFRALAQLEYATPLFVPSVSSPLPLPSRVEPGLAATYKAHPEAFARFPPQFADGFDSVK